MKIQSPGSRQGNSSNWSFGGLVFCHGWLTQRRHELSPCEHVLRGDSGPRLTVFPKEEAELASLQSRGHKPHLRARQEDVQKDGNGLMGGGEVQVAWGLVRSLLFRVRGRVGISSTASGLTFTALLSDKGTLLSTTRHKLLRMRGSTNLVKQIC